MKTCNKCFINKELKNFSKRIDSKDGFRNTCKNCRVLLVNEYYNKNVDIVKKYQHSYYNDNKDKKKGSVKQYNLINPGKKIAISAKYRATKLKATPKWLTKEHLKEIEKFYIKAKELELETNIKYHVDHIVPLQGETVSGLHVPWNLRVIPAEDNLRKSNSLV